MMNLPRLQFTALFLFFCLLASCARATPEASFWVWFQANEAMLFDFESDQARTFDKLHAEMQKVSPGLTFEFGPKKAGQREFIISADGNRKLFPAVEKLFTSAPKLAKWQLIKFRPRREPFEVQYKDVTVKPDTVKILMQADGDKAGIAVLIDGYTEAKRNAYVNIAYLLLDQALGEFDVETRVGLIKVQAPGAGTAGAMPLVQLPVAFDAFFAQNKAGAH